MLTGRVIALLSPAGTCFSGRLTVEECKLPHSHKDSDSNHSAEEPQPDSTSAAKQVAEKCAFRPSGVKTPDESADFMSCLSFLRQDEKARPTKLKSFSVTCTAD